MTRASEDQDEKIYVIPDGMFAGMKVYLSKSMPRCPACHGSSVVMTRSTVDAVAGCLDCEHTWRPL